MMNILEKLAKASKSNPELKGELTAINEKLVALAKKYPIGLSAEEATASGEGFCVIAGSHGCIIGGD